jgi:hypothetical protein
MIHNAGIRAAGCAALFVLLVFAQTSVAHAGWRTGHSGPPAWKEIKVCPEEMQFEIGTFSYTETPPPTRFHFQIFRGSGYLTDDLPQLAEGIRTLPAESRYVEPSLIPSIYWRPRRPGWFDYYDVLTFGFQPGMRVQPGDTITLEFRVAIRGVMSLPMGGTYEVQDCGPVLGNPTSGVPPWPR